MQPSPIPWLPVCVLAGLACALMAAEVESPAALSLTPANFARLQAQIKPEAGEDKWTQIPWLTSLWQARKRAAAEGKPILLWEMDGHPLGCT
jgi:hypothetical protein